MADGRTVAVPLARLGRWLDGFAARHGAWLAEPSSDVPPDSIGDAPAQGEDDGTADWNRDAAAGFPDAAADLNLGAPPGFGGAAADGNREEAPGNGDAAADLNLGAPPGFGGEPADGNRDAAPGFGDEQAESQVGAPAGWWIRAVDGASARILAPAWLTDVADGAAALDPARAPALDPAGLAALAPQFGVVLVRRAGYAVAVFRGRELAERKIATRHIHGRTAAGGWSQQRYARRRANQADEIVSACASTAAAMLARPHRDPIRFLVTGGDRPLVTGVLAALPAPLAAIPVRDHLAVGTPDRTVLAAIPDRVLAVTIELPETPDDGPGPGGSPPGANRVTIPTDPPSQP